MQKKLILVAVAGALAAPLAFAQGNVTISGRFQAGIESYKVSGGAVSETGLRFSDQSSRIIFSGSEDLGGGLKALFQLDSRFQTDTASLSSTGTVLWATGNTHVGLGGGFGSVRLGRQDLHYLEFLPIELYRAGSLQDLMQAGPMAQVNGTNAMIPTRSANVLWWDSPNWGGVTARVAYSTNPAGNEGSETTANGPDGEAINLAVRWSSGPLALGLSLWDHEVEGSGGASTNESMRLYGGFTFPFGLKVGLGFDSSEIEAAGATTERDAFMLPVTFSVGAHNFYFTPTILDEADTAAGTLANSDATALVVGWDMALSKRTQVGVYYATVDNEAAAAYNLFSVATNGAAAATAGTDPKQLYFGIGHSF